MPHDDTATKMSNFNAAIQPIVPYHEGISSGASVSHITSTEGSFDATKAAPQHVAHTQACSTHKGNDDNFGSFWGQNEDDDVSLGCPPPLEGIIEQEKVCNPSPLTLPSNCRHEKNNDDSKICSQNEGNNKVLVSVHCINFDITDAGVALSVPGSTTQQPASKNNENTYRDGYDSNNELGPFFDAVAEEKNDSEEMDDEKLLVKTCSQRWTHLFLKYHCFQKQI